MISKKFVSKDTTKPDTCTSHVGGFFARALPKEHPRLRAVSLFRSASDQALELLELAVGPARDLGGEAEDDLKRVAEVSD